MKCFTILLLCICILCPAGCEKKRHEIGKTIDSSLKKMANDAEFEFVKKRYEGIRLPENCFDDPKVIALCHAIIQEDTVRMKQIILDGADVNARGKREKQEISLLIYALPFGENVLRCLLQHGADTNTEKNVFNIAINYRLSDDPRYKNYLKILLEYGANPESHENCSPLIQAASHTTSYEFELKKPFSYLVTLVEMGTDINRETEGRYAVTESAKFCCYNNLFYLLESGAAYDIKTIPGGELQRILYRQYDDYQKNKKRLSDLEKDKSKAELVKAINKGNEQLLKNIQWLEEHGVSFDKPVSRAMVNSCV
jgi:hypothetical protein